MSEYFELILRVPRRIRFEGNDWDREGFFEHLWAEFGQKGLTGIHEGTVLSEEAETQGLETASWTVDAGEAPRERDWVSEQSESSATLFLDTLAHASAVAAHLEVLKRQNRSFYFEGPRECASQDWNANWKASFLQLENGLRIPPNWRVFPPWVENPQVDPGEIILKVNPGAGFGTGTHETTQLCLKAIAHQRHCTKGQPGRALDFGSGSGILTAALARLGWNVDGVEIDPLAIDNANENAKINGLNDDVVRFTFELGPSEPCYEVIVANILRPVLVEFAGKLAARLLQGGGVILSGLIEQDVAQVSDVYSKCLGRKPSRVESLGEWRSIVWDHLAITS
ncbi:50S ribosomal protein L11 methyltransferase [Bdellovibrionota bacterium FG-2]